MSNSKKCRNRRRNKWQSKSNNDHLSEQVKSIKAKKDERTQAAYDCGYANGKKHVKCFNSQDFQMFEYYIVTANLCRNEFIKNFTQNFCGVFGMPSNMLEYLEGWTKAVYEEWEINRPDINR